MFFVVVVGCDYDGATRVEYTNRWNLVKDIDSISHRQSSTTPSRFQPQTGFCGKCIGLSIKQGKNPLEQCGNFTVFTQMDMHYGKKPIYPQVQYLEQLYEAAPNATCLLPFRNISQWVHSLSHWPKNNGHPKVKGPAGWTYHKRFQNLVLPELNWTRDMGGDPADFDILFCRHVRNVRRFVSQHPSWSLVEFQLEDPHAGDYLASILRVNASFWGQSNNNKDIHRRSLFSARETRLATPTRRHSDSSSDDRSPTSQRQIVRSS